MCSRRALHGLGNPVFEYYIKLFTALILASCRHDVSLLKIESENESENYHSVASTCTISSSSSSICASNMSTLITPVVEFAAVRHDVRSQCILCFVELFIFCGSLCFYILHDSPDYCSVFSTSLMCPTCVCVFQPCPVFCSLSDCLVCITPHEPKVKMTSWNYKMQKCAWNIL